MSKLESISENNEETDVNNTRTGIDLSDIIINIAINEKNDCIQELASTAETCV